jgi:ribosomal silencing factor RsfS
MKTEKSILMLTSLSLLAFAIFTSYHTPLVDQRSETEYVIDIENYKRATADKISVDVRRMKELAGRFEINQGVDRKDDESELITLKEKINELKAALNNYEANGAEEWKLFKEKFENDLAEQHESLINLIIKTSNSLNNDKSIQSFVKP